MANVNPETEYQYMPSNWSKRIAAEEICAAHVEVTTRESNSVRSDPRLSPELAVPTVKGDVVDIFNSDGASGTIVVYVSGGYWLELSGEISAYPVRPLVAAGHTVIVLHYDRAPHQDLSHIVQQVERSICWVVEYAEKCNKKVWLTGHSAGGHLCGLVLSSPWFHQLTNHRQKIILGVVHLAGVFDLLPILDTSVNTVLKLSKEQAIQFSPVSTENITRLSGVEHLKHHLVLGEHDSPAFHKQAEQYRTALTSRGCKTSLHVLPSLDHFDLVENLAIAESSSAQLLAKLISSQA